MPAVLKAVQSWEAVMAANATTVDASIPVTVDPAKSFLYISWRTRTISGSTGPEYGVTGWIDITGTKVVLERMSQPSTDPVTITVTVVEFTSGVSVQRGVVNGVTSSTPDVSITSVDLSKSWAMCFQKGAFGWAPGCMQMHKVNFQNASSIRLRNGYTSTNNSCRWEVVQHDDASVQAFDGTQASGVTVTNLGITTVDMAKTFLVGSYTSEAVNTALITVANWYLQSASNVRHERTNGYLFNQYSIFVVSIASGCTVQRNTKGIAAGLLIETQSITPITTTKSLIITGAPCNCFQRTSSNTYDYQDYPVQSYFSGMAGSEITWQRNATVAPTTIISYWQVVSFESVSIRVPDMSMFLTAMH